MSINDNFFFHIMLIRLTFLIRVDNEMPIVIVLPMNICLFKIVINHLRTYDNNKFIDSQKYTY